MSAHLAGLKAGDRVRRAGSSLDLAVTGVAGEAVTCRFLADGPNGLEFMLSRAELEWPAPAGASVPGPSVWGTPPGPTVTVAVQSFGGGGGGSATKPPTLREIAQIAPGDAAYFRDFGIMTVLRVEGGHGTMRMGRHRPHPLQRGVPHLRDPQGDALVICCAAAPVLAKGVSSLRHA